MMTLGMFVFDAGTLPYQELQRRRDWRHARADRFGARPASQYVGPGADQVTLSGKLLPQLAGRYSAIETVADMAAQGESWTLIDGSGQVLGEYQITALDTTARIFMDQGLPRETDFTLTLERVD